jgi:hypothetical protein
VYSAVTFAAKFARSLEGPKYSTAVLVLITDALKLLLCALALLFTNEGRDFATLRVWRVVGFHPAVLPAVLASSLDPIAVCIYSTDLYIRSTLYKHNCSYLLPVS